MPSERRGFPPWWGPRLSLIGGRQDRLPRVPGTLPLGGRSALEAPLAPHESLDLATTIDDTLLPGIEGVAIRAHVDPKLLLSRARGEGITACAHDLRIVVIGGMNTVSHVDY